MFYKHGSLLPKRRSVEHVEHIGHVEHVEHVEHQLKDCYRRLRQWPD
jgi:hypothetical protein